MSDPKKKTARAVFLALPVLLAVFFTWSILIETNLLLVHEFDIQPPGWNVELNGLRIAVISDLHAGSLWIDENKIEEIVKKTNAAHPDLILMAGDYVCNRGQECPIAPEIFCKPFAKLHAPLGVFAVLGNHDWNYGGIRITKSLRNAGISVLENRSVYLPYKKGGFWLTGIEDLRTRSPNVEAALKAVLPGQSNIVLTHDPNVFPQIPKSVNLTIVGHTHGGQVWLPLLHLVAPAMGAFEPYVKDVVVQKNGMMFISVGIGTSVFPIRFLNAPEISVLNLRSR